MIDSTSMAAVPGPGVAQRSLAFAGAVLAAASVALSAYASHVAVGAGQAALLIGAAIAFGHGLALAALSRQARRRMTVLALVSILAGTLLFSGGLVVAHFTSAAARTAPFGGSLLIVAWLAWAVDALRK